LRFKIKEIPQLGAPKRVVQGVPGELLAEVLAPVGGDPAASKAELDAELMRDHDQVIVHGRIRATLALPCSRCLEPATVKVSPALDAVFTREGAEPEAPADVEALLEAPDAFVHDGVTIALDEACREILIAELPLSPKCSSNCKGLCAICGANLNTEPCSHPKAEPELPVGGALADGLKGLKIS
jgi:uncharacterized protein